MCQGGCSSAGAEGCQEGLSALECLGRQQLRVFKAGEDKEEARGTGESAGHLLVCTS